MGQIMVCVNSGRLILVWSCLIAVGIICSSPARTLAQEQPKDKELAAILEDWKFRQGLMKSVRYVLKGSTEFRDEPKLLGNPIQPRQGILLLDLINRRYRYESSEAVRNAMGHGEDETHLWQYTQQISTTAFDGKRWQHFRNRKENGIEEDVDDLHITKGKMSRSNVFDPLLNPIFFAHGIVGTVHKPLVLDSWPETQDSDDFRILGQQLFDGIRCSVLRTDPLSIGGGLSVGQRSGKNGGSFDEYWINKKQKSAIQRYFFFSNGNPWVHLEINWKETPHGWWVDEWSNTWSSNNTVMRISHYQIESMDVNPPVSDADFILKPEPGMKVLLAEGSDDVTGRDPTKPISLKTYRISTSGAWIEISQEGVPVKNWGAWYGVIATCAILALIIFGIRRHYKLATH